jgi:hypothetical protein
MLTVLSLMALGATLLMWKRGLGFRGAVILGVGFLVAAGAFGSCVGWGGKPRIVVEARVLKYIEKKMILEFQIDWFPEGRVVYVQKADRWKDEMPEWAKERRGEIFPEMRRLAERAGYKFRWEEY